MSEEQDAKTGLLKITAQPAEGDAFSVMLAVSVFDRNSNLLTSPDEISAFLTYMFRRKRPNEKPPEIERLKIERGVGLYGTVEPTGPFPAHTMAYVVVGQVHVHAVLNEKTHDDVLRRHFLDVLAGARVSS